MTSNSEMWRMMIVVTMAVTQVRRHRVIITPCAALSLVLTGHVTPTLATDWLGHEAWHWEQHFLLLMTRTHVTDSVVRRSEETPELSGRHQRHRRWGQRCPAVTCSCWAPCCSPGPRPAPRRGSRWNTRSRRATTTGSTWRSRRLGLARAQYY